MYWLILLTLLGTVVLVTMTVVLVVRICLNFGRMIGRRSHEYSVAHGNK